MSILKEIDDSKWECRDRMIANERSKQAKWTFTVDINSSLEQFFVTFPFPYMNGRLHLGHGYSLSKAEFSARFKRMCGLNVLFPFAFHGTGMPILACANKLQNEISLGIEGPQTKILLDMDVPKEDIPKFVNPYHWIEYFSEKAKDDLTVFGASIDFSRSFFTTDRNPYFDSFVKWQFRILKDIGVLVHGNKPIIYSPKDDQACADHDRSSGEGVGVKEYDIVIFRNELYDILVATTRIETVDCVTNLWIDQDQMYNVYKMDGRFVICGTWGALNMKYQNRKMDFERQITGSELIGMNVVWKDRIVPILHNKVNVEKGTGIVMSSPGHSINDFKMAQTVGITDFECCIAIDGKPVVEIFKELIAKKKSVDEISRTVFKMENESGIMCSGPFIGLKCEDARKKMSEMIIEQQLGWKYWEPEETVISRSGDRCVVAITEQYFINYAVQKDRVLDYVKNKMNCYNSFVLREFIDKIEWLKEWPCSRSFGLGTQLCDTNYLIDSLSDSTIYTAFYTIAHLIVKIPVNCLSYELWEYIFRDGVMPNDEQLVEYHDLLVSMKESFKYWYPVSLRVSGKDLVGNHLPMMLFNHMFVFGDEKTLPRNIHVNGHLLLNGEKMSKSTGNFITLRQAIDKFGADATRFALALSGTGKDDGNFVPTQASSAIKQLDDERTFFESWMNQLTDNENSFLDEVFLQEINRTVVNVTKEYHEMNFQRAVIIGFYELINIRKKHKTTNKNVVVRYLNVQLALLYPICPHFCEEIWDMMTEKGLEVQKVWPTVINENKKYLWLNDRLNHAIEECRKLYVNKVKTSKDTDFTRKAFEFSVISMYSQKELDIIKFVRERFLTTSWAEIKKDVQQLATDKKDIASVSRMASFVKQNIEEYGMCWCDWMHDNLNFESVLNLITETDIKNIVVKFIEMDSSMIGKYGPGYPIIKIVDLI